MGRTDTARRLLDLPLRRANDVEVVEVTAAGARTRWPFDPSPVGNPEAPPLHGGAVAAMADLVGAAAVERRGRRSGSPRSRCRRTEPSVPRPAGSTS